MNRVGDSETNADTCSMSSRMWFSWSKEQRLAPERLVAPADEEIAEGHAGESRADRQHCERNQHHQRRFMRGMIAVAVIPVTMTVMRARQARRPVAALAEESHEHEAPGIERGQSGRDVGAPERVHRAEAMRDEGGLDDRVLRHEPGKADRREWNADGAQRQRADHHHPESDRHLLSEPAHRAHVLLVMHRGDHRAAQRNNSALKKAWVKRWKMPRL